MILEDFDMNSADRQMDFSNPSLIAEIQKRYYCVYKQQISHYTKSSLICDAGRRGKKKRRPGCYMLTTRTPILPRKIGRFKNDRA